MPPPYRVNFDKTCWCGKVFRRRDKQRCRDFLRQRCCSPAHERILVEHERAGTPLEEGASSTRKVAITVSCPACEYRKEDEFGPHCGICNERGSQFRLASIQISIPAHIEEEEEDA